MVQIESAHEFVSPEGQKRIEYARALFERLEGVSRQRSTIDEAIRNFRILELMKR